MGSHYTKEYNVMGEILLSRYDLFTRHPQLDWGSHQTNPKTNNQQPLTNNHSKTHITTNLNTDEIEKRYWGRVRSRLREMLTSLLLEITSKDRRK